MTWTLSNDVVVDATGANVTGLVPSRMTEATLALALAAPAMLAALEGMNHVTEGGYCICPCKGKAGNMEYEATVRRLSKETGKSPQKVRAAIEAADRSHA